MEIKHGVVEDPRPQHLKDKDHKHERLYSGMPVNWVEKPESEWVMPSQRNQDGSTSCVMQGADTAIEKITGQIISACVFKLRADPTQGGMYLQNAGDILYNIGTDLEANTSSQRMNDAEMDAIVLPLKFRVKITGYRTFIDHTNIDAIAQAINNYGHCNITFNSNGDEWQITPVYLGTPITFGHNICAVDFLLINGIKYLLCRDSDGQWTSPKGYRLINADFLAKRSTGAMYFLGATIEPIEIVPVTPQVIATTTEPVVPVVIPNKLTLWQRMLLFLTHIIKIL